MARDDGQQFAMNTALFVPLGMFLRQVFRRGVVATLAIGVATTLFVEFTQLTGNWSVSPCPYRLFAVDDLVANAVGTGVGVLLAPLVRLVPGQRAVAAPGSAPPGHHRSSPGGHGLRRPPGAAGLAVAWLVGLGGPGVLAAAGLAGRGPGALGFAAAHVVALVLVPDGRGMTGLPSGLHTVDSRPARSAGHAETPEADVSGTGAST